MAGPEISNDIKDPERQVEKVEKKDSSEDEKLGTSDNNPIVLALELDEAEERRILRKVDWRLVPILSLLYLIAFIDRSNSKHLRPYPGPPV